MDFIKSFKANLFNITEVSFSEAALSLFNFQYNHNALYKKYIDLLGINPAGIYSIYEIPFLPIEFFKYHQIKSGSWLEETCFESSGTTDATKSKHYVEDTAFYLKNARTIFERFYGSIDNYTIVALLPSYLERNCSSLVYMADHFIKQSNSSHSGFYLNNFDDLIKKLTFLKNNNLPTIIIGVTFALLELAERFEFDLSGMIFMETGGMKGRREEITREEVHAILKNRFSIEKVHTEYGMTEMLSQAYGKEDGVLETAPWLKILIRDINDPFDLNVKRNAGGLNIIDLANVHSCAFIESKDIGNFQGENRFKVLGRLDNAEIRGCNLLI